MTKEAIIQLILENKLEVVLMASITTLFTSFSKIAVKKHLKNQRQARKVIATIPILFSALITYLYQDCYLNEKIVSEEFFTMWLAGLSLSTSFYAFYENYFKKTKSDKMLESQENFIEMIQKIKKE